MEIKLEHVLLFLLFVFLLKMIMDKCGCKGLVEGMRPDRPRNIINDGGAPAVTQAPTPPQEPVDCVGRWTTCNSDCEKTYRVSTQASNGGKNCPATDGEKRKCSGGSCSPVSCGTLNTNFCNKRSKTLNADLTYPRGAGSVGKASACCEAPAATQAPTPPPTQLKCRNMPDGQQFCEKNGGLKTALRTGLAAKYLSTDGRTDKVTACCKKP
jgi:hypothetical protein